ncbi:RidA family protein [Campylobacter jejuni]|nr:RidA family protein [Campylobacter jejuni]EAI0874053.1 RidA family protein [Campylobacter jejuni]EAK2670310.1 RidA family protein [Campylobacter jejuni]EAL1196729.1 RidA family protein [Campylobacter jejuni]ECC1949338.1 RidA family protein [Campylobacter jejuni]
MMSAIECRKLLFLINILRLQDKCFEPSGDIKKQTKEALAELDALFEKIGASKGDLIQIQIWLANMQDFDATNEIYDAWIKNYPKPVRACVGSALAEGYLVEIQAFGKLREN